MSRPPLQPGRSTARKNEHKLCYNDDGNGSGGGGGASAAAAADDQKPRAQKRKAVTRSSREPLI